MDQDEAKLYCEDSRLRADRMEQNMIRTERRNRIQFMLACIEVSLVAVIAFAVICK